MSICKNCNLETVGKSKYCAEHKVIAHQAFNEMIAAKKNDKESQLKDYKNLLDSAIAAGEIAASNCIPEPMIVVQRESVWDDNSPIVEVFEPVMGGVCGFAWITIKPANSAFANFIKKQTYIQSHKAYTGGLSIWVSAYGQSMELKQAFASAFAKVLKDAGINAYSESRMD